MAQPLWQCSAELKSRDEGVAAVEFAMIAPVLIILIMIGVDVGRYLYATEQLSRAANTIGQMLTSSSPQTLGAPVTVTDADLQFVRDSAMVIYPDALLDSASKNIAWSMDIAITISSVSFMPGPVACQGATCTYYTPKVIWSGGTYPRSCSSVMTAAASTMVPSATTLPVDTFPGPGTGTAGTPTGNIVVVDISYTYSPLLGAGIFSALMPVINRSVFVAPRYTKVGLNYTGSTFANQCP